MDHRELAMFGICDYCKLGQASFLENGDDRWREIICECGFWDDSYVKPLNIYETTLIEKWFYPQGRYLPLDYIPSNALSISRCTRCRYHQSWIYENGRTDLVVCDCSKWYGGMVSSYALNEEEMRLVEKWLPSESDIQYRLGKMEI